MFRAFFTFDAPAIVLTTEARSGFFFWECFNFKRFCRFKINFPAKERVPWERACTVYTHPQDHLRFQYGGGAVYSNSLVIIGREMIDDLPDPGPIEENKILAKMARVTRMARMARTVAHMARWLADLVDP